MPWSLICAQHQLATGAALKCWTQFGLTALTPHRRLAEALRYWPQLEATMCHTLAMLKPHQLRVLIKQLSTALMYMFPGYGQAMLEVETLSNV